MNKQEKMIAAFLAILMVGWFIWSTQNAPQPPPKGDAPQEQISDAPTTEDQGQTTAETPTIEKQQEKPQKSETSPDAHISYLTGFRGLKPAEPVTLKIIRGDDDVREGPELALVTIDPEKGGITGVLLPDHAAERLSEERVVLGDKENPMLAITAAAGNELTFSHARIADHTDTRLVIERQIMGTKAILRQTWKVNAGSFKIDYDFSIINKGEETVSIQNLRVAAGVMAPLIPPKGMFGASGYDQRAQYKAVTDSDSDFERVQSITGFEEDDIRELATENFRWISVQNKFFTTSLKGIEDITGCSFETPINDNEANKKIVKEAKKHRDLIGYAHVNDLPAIAANAEAKRSYEFYIGPKIYERLKAMGDSQHQIMGFDLFILWHFDFMRWFALAIYKLLAFINGFVSNFGLAIIISTVIIRLLFSPITYKSSVWSQRMKEIQPKMKEIREKFSNDQQKVQTMTMQLYKEHKINPIGGCLPIFFQIPVFFALFNVLRSAIELRHAELGLWIMDLSQPDMLFIFPESLPVLGGIPFNVLPFLMGGAMYLQQKMMPTSADPMQQKMMGFMSIFITFMCYSMPSGLTLYWTVSNVCSIVQFRITHKLIEKKTKAEE